MAGNVTIMIPTALRPQVDGKEQVAQSGGTVGEALRGLCEQHPELGKRLYKTDEELNRFINVYINDEDIRFLDNLQTPVKDGDEVSIVPAIAGG